MPSSPTPSPGYSQQSRGDPFAHRSESKSWYLWGLPGPLLLPPWLCPLEFLPPKPFWLYWPLTGPLKDQNVGTFHNRASLLDIILGGCLSCPLCRKALQWPCYWKPGPSFTFCPSCSVFITAFTLCPSCTVMYWFYIVYFLSCEASPRTEVPQRQGLRFVLTTKVSPISENDACLTARMQDKRERGSISKMLNMKSLTATPPPCRANNQY